MKMMMFDDVKLSCGTPIPALPLDPMDQKVGSSFLRNGPWQMEREAAEVPAAPEMAQILSGLSGGRVTII